MRYNRFIVKERFDIPDKFLNVLFSRFVLGYLLSGIIVFCISFWFLSSAFRFSDSFSDFFSVAGFFLSAFLSCLLGFEVRKKRLAIIKSNNDCFLGFFSQINYCIDNCERSIASGDKKSALRYLSNAAQYLSSSFNISLYFFSFEMFVFAVLFSFPIWLFFDLPPYLHLVIITIVYIFGDFFFSFFKPAIDSLRSKFYSMDVVEKMYIDLKNNYTDYRNWLLENKEIERRQEKLKALSDKGLTEESDMKDRYVAELMACGFPSEVVDSDSGAISFDSLYFDPFANNGLPQDEENYQKTVWIHGVLNKFFRSYSIANLRPRFNFEKNIYKPNWDKAFLLYIYCAFVIVARTRGRQALFDEFRFSDKIHLSESEARDLHWKLDGLKHWDLAPLLSRFVYVDFEKEKISKTLRLFNLDQTFYDSTSFIFNTELMSKCIESSFESGQFSSDDKFTLVSALKNIILDNFLSKRKEIMFQIDSVKALIVKYELMILVHSGLLRRSVYDTYFDNDISVVSFNEKLLINQLFEKLKVLGIEDKKLWLVKTEEDILLENPSAAAASLKQRIGKIVE